MITLMELLKNNKLFIVAAMLLFSSLTAYAVSQPSLSISNEITFQDPADSRNYMILNNAEHSFYIHQPDETLSGTYTETSESYNLNYDQGFGQVALKKDNGVLSPKGNLWKKV